MNVLLGADSASCVVKCPWQNPMDRNHNYAALHLQPAPLKRRRARSSARREPGCKLVASIWYHERDSATGSFRKNLTRSNTSEAEIAGWDGQGKILTINNAFDTDTHLQYTWVALSVSKKKSGRSGVAILRFDKKGIVLWKVLSVKREMSDSVAILRGPTILCETADGLRFFEQSEDDASMKQRQLDFDSHEDSQLLISRSESDIEAFVLMKLASDRIQLYAIHYKDSSRQISINPDAIVYPLRIMKALVRERLLVVVSQNGAVAGIDLHTGKQRWHIDASNRLEDCCNVSVFQDMVIFSTTSTSDLWYTTVYNSSDPLGQVRIPKLLFSGSCSTTGSQHNYIYAVWRKRLLQHSSTDGSCCCEQQNPSNTTQAQQPQSALGESNLSQVTSNLERRLSVGVERLMQTSSRKEAMMRMLHHSSSLLMEATGNIPRIQSTKLFRSQTSNLIALPGRKSSISNIPMSDKHDELPQSTRIAVVGQSVLLDGTRFLRLVRSSCGLDRSRQFIVVQVNVALLESSTAEDENKPATISLALNIQFDKCMATLWNVQEKQGLKSSDLVWLTAYAPIASLVTSNSASLSEMSIVVRADSSDGRSQPLGTLSVAKAMSCNVDLGVMQAAPWRAGRSLFEQKVCAIASGPSAHRLFQLKQSSEVMGNVGVQTRQDLAYVTFSATSGVEIAMAIARIKSCVDDDVVLRSSPGLCKNSLKPVDAALNALDEEVRHLRSIVSRRGCVGYDADEIKHVLMKQLFTDEAMGSLEEHLLGT